MARYVKLGTEFHTRYGNVRCVSRDGCPCEDCAFSHTDDVGLPWKHKKICYEVFPCNAENRRDHQDVAFESLPDDYFTNREYYKHQGL